MNVLKEKRLALGLKQEDLARKTGRSRALIGKIETGVSRPSVETAIKLAKVLGIDWKVFFKDLCE